MVFVRASARPHGAADGRAAESTEIPVYWRPVALPSRRGTWRSARPVPPVSLASGRVVGPRSYGEPRSRRPAARLAAIEVGFTWLARSAQGTGVNAEAKLPLFQRAFEEWGVARVDLKTDARNSRSRAAIER